MRSTFILVPTSTEKREGGTGSGWIRSFPEFDENRHAVADAAERYLRSPTIRAVAANRRPLFERLQRNADVFDRPTMLAIDRYDNALFGAIDHSSLSHDARSRLDEQLLVFSGMWGLVRPTDRIPDYCLSMTDRMPQVSGLASFWQPSISATMNRIAAGAVVWDLLPSRTSDVWAMGKHPTVTKRIFVRFRDAKSRDINTKGASVAARGALARFIVEHQPATIEDLGEFVNTTSWRIDRSLLVTDGLRVGLTLTASDQADPSGHNTGQGPTNR